MNFIEFTKAFGDNAVIDIQNVITYFDGLDRRRLYEWQKKKYLRKIANNFYIFSGKIINDDTLKNIACRIYRPSYVGLESALVYYRFIPEAVFQTVSLTTRRNKVIRTAVGDFRYRSIKRDLFFGYSVVSVGKESFFISDPEKTLLDFLYFSPGSDKKEDIDEMRLNGEEIRRTIEPKKMRRYLALFASSKLEKAVAQVMRSADVEF